MIIQHNMTANNTNRQLGITNSNLAKSSEKLSSGYRINRAADDAAGLSISEKMRGQVRGLDRASANAQDGISLIQTAEGALNEVHSILQRQRELAVQAANDTNVTADREAIQKEMTQLNNEIDRIAESTEFNTMKLLNGNGGESADADTTSVFYLQVGANRSDPDADPIGNADGDVDDSAGIQEIKINISSIKTSMDTMGSDAGKLEDITNLAEDGVSHTNAATAIDIIDGALEFVSNIRSDLGAKQNRLEHTIANADNTSENLQSAESRIRDVNMADEMVKYSKDTILQQAAQSMLAQANQSTQGVLSLLQ